MDNIAKKRGDREATLSNKHLEKILCHVSFLQGGLCQLVYVNYHFYFTHNTWKKGQWIWSQTEKFAFTMI